MTLRAQKPVFATYPPELKTIGDHLKKRRLDLNVQQVDVAGRLGVTVCTIRNWEKNRNTPEIRHLSRITDFLGYQPWNTGCRTLGERIVNQRQKLGLSQRNLARKLGLSPDTIADWEKARHKPSRDMLRMLAAYLVYGRPPRPTCKLLKPGKKTLFFEPKSFKTVGEHLKIRRRELKLTQEQAAKRMNTSVWAVQGWERNKYTPKIYHMRSIIKFLGYVPKGMLPRTEADQVIFCRAILGLTQKELGQLLGVCDTNISRWESGKNRPKEEYLQKLTSLASIPEFR